VSEDVKAKVDIDSPEFKAGVEAGLNSTAATKDWQAGLELGQRLKVERENKVESENKEAVQDVLFKEPSLPLFLRDGSEGNKDNAQDEKDETAE
jgi:hypothetical protein